MKTKIQLTDTLNDILRKLSDGNPGAITVCARLFERGTEIDPDAALGHFAALLDLDALNIYGSDIWLLYKDVCGENLPTVVALLRANQLGFLTAEQLRHAIANRGAGIDVGEICSKVRERLPNFYSDLSVEQSFAF